MGIEGGTFLGLAWFKNFSTWRIPFYLGGQYLTTAMNFYKNLSLIKVVLLPWNFLSLRNLASHYMSWSSKEIISLQKLYCCFEVVFLLKILLRTLDMVVTEESSLRLSFSKKISRFKNVIRVTGTFCICLILHILSSKYFEESSHPILEQIFIPFDCLSSRKFLFIGLNSGFWNFPVKLLVSI